MEIRKVYSHKGGEAFIRRYHSVELKDVEEAVSQVSAAGVLSKVSDEKTKKPLLFSPVALNKSIKEFLHARGWTEQAHGKSKGFKEPRISFGKGQFREMDGIKNKVGIEVQFGKYAFMGYDIFSKMPIFAKHGLIKCGIELVAMPDVVKNMSTGVSSFDQIERDMIERGVSDLDIPTLIIGISCTKSEWDKVEAKRSDYARSSKRMLANGQVSGPRRGAKPGPKPR